MGRYILRCLLIVSVFIGLNLSMPILYAAANYDCTKGNHEYESKLIRINTEYEEGLVENTCVRCGYSYLEVLPVTGHHWSDWELKKESEQDSPGIEQRECIGCGAIERRVIPAVNIEEYEELVPAAEVEAEEIVIETESVQVPETTIGIVDGVLVGSIIGTWVYVLVILWYNSLVTGWDARQYKKRMKNKKGEL